MQEISFKAFLRQYFDMSENREKEEDIVQAISSGVSFKGANLWILIFAIFMASLGLNVNSTAVIIGAMLISPLMGPIIGMGLAVGVDDLPLLRRAVKNYLIASVIGIITATVYFFLSPYQGVQSELLARTSPTIYDVLIAFFGGAAGITAVSVKDKGNVIPGVAIATALMPPLCTAGYGIATGNLVFFAGAFLLYFINTVFIAVATTFGVLLMKFRRKHFVDPQRRKFVHRIIFAIVVITMIPAGYMTIRMMRQSLFERQINIFVRNNLNWKGTQIISQRMDGDSILQVVAVGKEITLLQMKAAQKELNGYSRLEHLKLAVIQGTESDSLMSDGNKIVDMATSTEEKIKVIKEQSAEIASLRKELSSFTSYDRLSMEMRKEIAVLYPEVKTLILTPVTQVTMDTVAPKRFVMAVVGLDQRAKLSNEQNTRIYQWLKTRTAADSLRLVMSK